MADGKVKEWTPEQWAAYHAVVEWSHRIAHEGARKLLEHAGMPQETLIASKVFNVQDDIAFAIRRGAIRVINELNKTPDSGIW